MNDQLQTYAKNTLKEGLAQCTESERLFFKQMYSHDNLELPIDEVVDNMWAEKLDWAMEQVQKTVEKSKASTKQKGGLE